MYKDVLETRVAEESVYVNLEEYLKQRNRLQQGCNRHDGVHKESHYLNTSQFAEFYRYVEETSRMHGYLEESTFADFLTMVSKCIHVVEDAGSDTENSDH